MDCHVELLGKVSLFVCYDKYDDLTRNDTKVGAARKAVSEGAMKGVLGK